MIKQRYPRHLSLLVENRASPRRVPLGDVDAAGHRPLQRLGGIWPRVLHPPARVRALLGLQHLHLVAGGVVLLRQPRKLLPAVGDENLEKEKETRGGSLVLSEILTRACDVPTAGGFGIEAVSELALQSRGVLGLTPTLLLKALPLPGPLSHPQLIHRASPLWTGFSPVNSSGLAFLARHPVAGTPNHYNPWENT